MQLSLLFHVFQFKFMKILYLLVILISLFFNLWAYWAPDHCVIAPNETRMAHEFLTACATMTSWIDPSNFSQDKEGTRNQIIAIANGAISFGALLAVWAIVWSGVQYTKAFGEDEKLKKAKATWIYSLIWLLLLLISFGMVDIFINFIYTITGN
jgi:hypothetical protein